MISYESGLRATCSFFMLKIYFREYLQSNPILVQAEKMSLNLLHFNGKLNINLIFILHTINISVGFLHFPNHQNLWNITYIFE